MDIEKEEFGAAQRAENHRANERFDVDAEIFVRQSTSQIFRATMSDVSVSGFRLHSLTNLDPEKLVFVSLPGLQTLAAHIKWVDYSDFGCEFVEQLHPAVLDHLVARLQEFGA